MSKIPLKPKNEKFTDVQWQAVYDSGNNLLVSASAGSGKTTVLVRRIIEKLKAGIPIDELLVVTFTEAAAREMKDRIEISLREAINLENDPEKRQYYVQQLGRLPNASISTLHAFCLSIIRQFYFVIDIDPVFRMLTDPTEELLLQEEVWEELREEKYAKKEKTFYRLVENFSSDRSDDQLTDLIMSLYRFSRANPSPESWLRKLAAHYDTSKGLEGNELYQTVIKKNLLIDLQLAKKTMNEILERVSGQDKLEKLLKDETEQLEKVTQFLLDDAITELYAFVQTLTFARYPSTRDQELKPLYEEAKKVRELGKESVKKVQQFFEYSPEKLLSFMENAAPIVDEMGKLTLLFTERYQKRKQEKGVLDFNDLEHLALKILKSPQENKDAASYYRSKFKEVLVDEYQDVNRLQEEILTYVRSEDSENGNLFMVGDVKQSIYAFRLADPTLFIEKYLSYESNIGGQRIILADNFRSRKEVLDFTNLIFEQLMDETVGQIPYDEAAKLQLGFSGFPESEEFHTEILLYEKEEASEEVGDFIEDKTEGELIVTALKIKELIDNKFEIFDKKENKMRLLDYKDIVLLTPTKKNNLTIMDIFKQFDIPLEVHDAQNYFQTTEIQIIISLLQIIDNPYQDIPLVAVLRSPIAGFTEPELAEIRLESSHNDFYSSLVAAYPKENALGEKIASFLSKLNTWRQYARRQSIASLLWKIYQESGYLDYVIGLQSGEQRHANLLALIHHAENYENSSFRGLYPFIRFVEKMQEKSKDLSEPVTKPLENAVRSMTIHASKGLEFPVVFVLDMTKQFNMQDFHKRYLLEENQGVGIQWVDQNWARFSTIPFEAIKQIRQQKVLSEEMRKLYVALTRAEQKLYLVGSYKSKEEIIKEWGVAIHEKTLVIDPSLRMASRGTLMKWVGMSLIRHPLIMDFLTDLENPERMIHHEAQFKIEWWSQKVLVEEMNNRQLTKEVNKTIELSPLTPEFLERLEFIYPHEQSTKTTSYQSVSEMKRLYNDPDDQWQEKLEWQSMVDREQQKHYRYVSDQLEKPSFMEDEKMSPALIGTATHSVLQLLPLRKMSRQELLEFIDQLVKTHYFSRKVADEIPLDTIEWFLETEFANQLISNKEKVKREQPFAMLKNAENVFDGFHDTKAELLVHGMIDGYLELDDEIILYDFKTDEVFGHEANHRLRARYQSQLNLYKEALENALDKPVTKMYLIALRLKEIITMHK